MPDSAITQTVTGDSNYVAGRDINVTNKYAAPPSDERARLVILLGKVKADWIHGFLADAAGDAEELEVETTRCDGDVERPWDSVRETLARGGSNAPSEKSIARVFEDAGRALLILGDAGSGKTIALLKLAKGLIRESEEDPAAAVPVVFNLSTWAPHFNGLVAWLIYELAARYYVGKRVAETWLGSERLLLLLDGLDEVLAENQCQCVNAINSFVTGLGVPGIAVCSRAGDYHALDNKLKLGAAIKLNPIAPDGAARYLAAGSARSGSLAASVQADERLRQLASSPLMLHIIATTYADGLPSAQAAGAPASVATETTDLLDAYLGSAFTQNARRGGRYTEAQSLSWLRWLAHNCIRQSQTLIALEQLQPSWLETRTSIVGYLLCSRITVSLLVALAVRYAFRAEVAYTLTVLLVCSLVGVVDIWRFLRRSRPAPRPFIFGLSYVFGFTAFFTFALEVFSFLFNSPWPYVMAALNGTTMGCIYGFFFWFRSRNRGLGNDIQTVEVFRWSFSAGWRAARRWGLVAGGGIFVWTIALFTYLLLRHAPASGHRPPTTMAAIAITLKYSTLYAVISGMTVGLVSLLLGGIKSGIRTGKTRLNQGIVLTLRNSLWLTAGVTVVFGVVYFMVAGMVGAAQHSVLHTVRAAAPEGAILTGDLAITTFFACGAIDVLNHYTLRLVAFTRGYMPLRYARFLRHAAHLRLLQRVGGSYVFMHRLLAQHLAAQYEKVTRIPPSQG